PEPQKKQTVCLNMIVKNESHVIKRCLDSFKHLIDYWVIVDTGSTDGTQRLIREHMKDIPGEVVDRPWVNFGHNRSEALSYARGRGDYIFTIDADEILWAPPDFEWPELTADTYLVEFASGPLLYYKSQLFNNGLDWSYKGILHEFAYCEEAHSQDILSGLKIIRYLDGARSSDPQKFQKDALTLEQALLDEPDNERYVFYLAQSYRDGGNLDRAIEIYQRRFELGGWPEEAWYALYQVAELRHKRGDDWPVVLDAYLKAYAFRPHRAEPLYKIMQHYLYKDHHLAHLFGRQAQGIPFPTQDLLFVEKSIYDFALALDLAVAAHWAGDMATAIALNNDLLWNPNLPPPLYDRVLKNRAFSLDAIYPRHPHPPETSNRIKVCVLFRNPGAFLDNCIESLLQQDYETFDMVFIDDASTDGSGDRVPVEDPRVSLIQNRERRHPLRNSHTFLTEHCAPNDIAVFVDGDDWLACDDALSSINEWYNAYQCWVLYGQFRHAGNGRHGGSRPYPDPAAFQRLRQNWYASHIRTFRAGVYQEIAKQDPDYRCMKNEAGAWYRAAGDVALMSAVMEVAGFDRTRFNDRVLYIYNDKNPLNENHEFEPDTIRGYTLEIARKPSLVQTSTIPGLDAES
ncbi:MAG: glycosyltransferase, partial [Verrucomicrobiota bacterium]